MEHQQEEEDQNDAVTVTETTSSTLPVAMKRSARMLHESSFATSSITTSRGSHNSKRPPGFIASSLDYHQGGIMNSPNYAASTSIEKNMRLTTKPVPDKNVIKERQEREQAEKERQYQQQRNYQNGNPTRAQGNFGPPPHKIKTLEDLEHMTEDQIYKLFMEDPELHASFMKAAENGNWDGKNPPTSAPVGARKARSSGTGSSPTTGKSSRSSTKRPQKKKVEEVDKEVPYFQWLFILIVLAAIINQIRKAYVASAATTAKKGVTPHGKKVKGGKSKNKKGANGTKKILPKKDIEPKRRSFSPLKQHLKKEAAVVATKKKEVVVVAAADTIAVDTTTTATTTTTTELSLSERRSSGSKKKKVKSKQKSTPVADKVEMDQGRQKPKQTLDSTNGSIADHEQEQEADKTEIAVEMKSIASSTPTTDSPDEGEWQSVDKSKGGKKGKTVSPANVENNIDDSLDIKEDNVSTDRKTMETKLDVTTEDVKEPLAERTAHETAPKTSKDKPKKKTNNNNSSNVEKENTTNGHPTANKANANGSAPIVKEDKKVSEEESFEKSNTKVVKEKSTVDDAALALQLHKEEVNLARAVTTNNRNDQQDDDVWEEVASKKKKGTSINV
jgi:hypothetical protein